MAESESKPAENEEIVTPNRTQVVGDDRALATDPPSPSSPAQCLICLEKFTPSELNGHVITCARKRGKEISDSRSASGASSAADDTLVPTKAPAEATHELSNDQPIEAPSSSVEVRQSTPLRTQQSLHVKGLDTIPTYESPIKASPRAIDGKPRAASDSPMRTPRQRNASASPTGRSSLALRRQEKRNCSSRDVKSWQRSAMDDIEALQQENQEKMTRTHSAVSFLQSSMREGSPNQSFGSLSAVREAAIRSRSESVPSTPPEAQSPPPEALKVKSHSACDKGDTPKPEVVSDADGDGGDTSTPQVNEVASPAPTNPQKVESEQKQAIVLSPKTWDTPTRKPLVQFAAPSSPSGAGAGDAVAPKQQRAQSSGSRMSAGPLPKSVPKSATVHRASSVAVREKRDASPKHVSVAGSNSSFTASSGSKPLAKRASTTSRAAAGVTKVAPVAPPVSSRAHKDPASPSLASGRPSYMQTTKSAAHKQPAGASETSLTSPLGLSATHRTGAARPRLSTAAPSSGGNTSARMSAAGIATGAPSVGSRVLWSKPVPVKDQSGSVVGSGSTTARSNDPNSTTTSIGSSKVSVPATVQLLSKGAGSPEKGSGASAAAAMASPTGTTAGAQQHSTHILFCIECGQKFLENAKFCGFCGKRREPIA